jgi:saccharopine dehydrogenase (NAD+, L-lysine-forming)
MNYAVVGAGSIGRCLILDILAEEPNAKFLALDVSKETLSQYGAPQFRNSVTTVVQDASDVSGLSRRLAGNAIVVNCSDGSRSVEILRAAIEAGVAYLDVHGTLLVKERLALTDDARRAGITAMIGMGCSPGITNMLGAYGARRAEGEVSVDVEYVTHRPINPTAGLLETFLRQFRDPVRAATFEDGETLLFPPFEGRLSTSMPGIPGEVELVYTPHSEPLTIPLFVKGLKRVTVRGTYQPQAMALLRTLSQFGLLNPSRKVMIGGETVDFQPLLREALFGDGPPRSSPIEPLYILRVRITSKINGNETISETTVGHDPGWDPLPQGRMTALPTAFTARLVANGKFRSPGVCGPELLSDDQVEACLDHLVSRGLWVHEKQSVYRRKS